MSTHALQLTAFALLGLAIVLNVLVWTGIAGRRRRPKAMPTNARAHLRDGSTVALDLTYLGRQGGVDVWQSVQILELGALTSISADKLPIRCAIQVQMEHVIR
jgi:hypothetical protein